MTAPIRTLEGMAHQLRLRGLPAEIAPTGGDGRLCIQVEPARGVRLTFERYRNHWLVDGRCVHPLPDRWLSDTGHITITPTSIPAVLRDCADWCFVQSGKARYRRDDERTALRLKSAACCLSAAATKATP